MILLTSLTSPYGRMLRILAIEHGLDVEIEVVNPWQDRSLLDKKSPLSKVPVLVLDDGSPIIDSSVIAEYLDSLGESPLLPADPMARLKVLSACFVCQGILASTTLIVSSKIMGEPVSDALAKWHLDKAEGGLKDLERRLEEGEFGKEGQFGMLDVFVASTIGFYLFRLGEYYDLAGKVPKLVKWYEKALERPSIHDTVPTPA